MQGLLESVGLSAAGMLAGGFAGLDRGRARRRAVPGDGRGRAVRGRRPGADPRRARPARVGRAAHHRIPARRLPRRRAGDTAARSRPAGGRDLLDRASQRDGGGTGAPIRLRRGDPRHRRRRRHLGGAGATRSSSRSRPRYERSRALGHRGGGRAGARRAGRRRRARGGRMERRAHRRRALDPHGRVCRPRLGAAAKGGWRSSAAAVHAAAWWPTGWSGRESTPSTWRAAWRPGTPPRCRSNRWTAGSRERAGGHLLLGGRIAQQALVPARCQLGRGPPALVRGALRHGRGQLQLLRPAHRGDGDRLGAPHAARLRLPRQGVRDDDPPSGAGRAAAARHALGGGVRRAGPDRPALAGAAKRGLPALPARRRAAA